jgi:hypothetical protein
MWKRGEVTDNKRERTGKKKVQKENVEYNRN